jgi:hypothetical protein
MCFINPRGYISNDYKIAVKFLVPFTNNHNRVPKYDQFRPQHVEAVFMIG